LAELEEQASRNLTIFSNYTLRAVHLWWCKPTHWYRLRTNYIDSSNWFALGHPAQSRCRLSIPGASQNVPQQSPGNLFSL